VPARRFCTIGEVACTAKLKSESLTVSPITSKLLGLTSQWRIDTR
jgi:hypothetical protein